MRVRRVAVGAVPMRRVAVGAVPMRRVTVAGEVVLKAGEVAGSKKIANAVRMKLKGAGLIEVERLVDAERVLCAQHGMAFLVTGRVPVNRRVLEAAHGRADCD